MIKVLKNELGEGTLLALVQEAAERVTNALSEFCDGVLQSVQERLVTIVFDDMMTKALTMRFFVFGCLSLLVQPEDAWR